MQRSNPVQLARSHDPSSGTPMRVLVLSHNDINLRGLESVLSDKYPEARIETCSSTEDLFAGLDAGENASAVILDCGGETEPLHAMIGRIARRSPETIIVLLTPKISDQEMFRLFERGVSAFLHNDMSAASFGSAMDLVLSGEKFAPYRIMRRALSADSGGLIREHLPGLSARQQEILALIAQGYSNKRIAAELGIKEVTVAFHIRAIFAKLGVSSRTQAVATAHSLGLTLGDSGREH